MIGEVLDDSGPILKRKLADITEVPRQFYKIILFMIMIKKVVMFHDEPQPSFCSGNCNWWSHCYCLWVGKGNALLSNSIIMSHDILEKHTNMKNASWNHRERKTRSTMRPCPRWRRTSTRSWTTRDNSMTKSHSSEMASPGRVWSKLWLSYYCIIILLYYHIILLYYYIL